MRPTVLGFDREFVSAVGSCGVAVLVTTIDATNSIPSGGAKFHSTYVCDVVVTTIKREGT